MRTRQSLTVLILALFAFATPARADVFNSLFDVLEFSNFTLDSNYDQLSNTSTAVAATVFGGSTFDLGDFDMSLSGPFSVVLQRGGRAIPEIEMVVSTGRLSVNQNQVTSVGAPQPLSYTLDLDTGTNTTSIDGNFLLDARAKINRYGSYDFRFQLANRRTTTIDGRFDTNSPLDSDFDIGPIDLQGNVFADLLATVTDPFFQAAGSENIFAIFGGRAAREQQSIQTVDALRTKVANGGSLTDPEISAVTSLSLVAQVLGDDFPELDFLTGSAAGQVPIAAGDTQPFSVPEPSTLLLLAAGAGFVVHRRFRRR